MVTLSGRREKIHQIVHDYSKMSFKVGQTLLQWMERHRPETYKAILDSDALSRGRFSGCVLLEILMGCGCRKLQSTWRPSRSFLGTGFDLPSWLRDRPEGVAGCRKASPGEASVISTSIQPWPTFKEPGFNDVVEHFLLTAEEQVVYNERIRDLAELRRAVGRELCWRSNSIEKVRMNLPGWGRFAGQTLFHAGYVPLPSCPTAPPARTPRGACAREPSSEGNGWCQETTRPCNWHVRQ